MWETAHRKCLNNKTSSYRTHSFKQTEVHNPEVSICDGMRPISLLYYLFLELLLLAINENNGNPNVHFTRLRTNQKRCGHQAQSDWPLFARTFILKLDNTDRPRPNERYRDFWVMDF